MSRSIRTATLLAAAALGVTLSACGTEQEAPAPTSVTSATVSENSSAPVVAGPKPASTTTSADDDVAAGERNCGTTSGPDGALRVLVNTEDIPCEEATTLAEKYGPMIATGKPQTVDGWECGPAQEAGVLASCSKDDAIISFAP